LLKRSQLHLGNALPIGVSFYIDTAGEVGYLLNPFERTHRFGLDEPRWSVISFDKCEAVSLTYKQAADFMSLLDARGIAGLCIVTDEAAKRLRS